MTTVFDAENIFGDPVSRVCTMPSGVGSATADLADTYGLITRFTTTFPEPDTRALVVLAGALLFLRRRSKLRCLN